MCVCAHVCDVVNDCVCVCDVGMCVSGVLVMYVCVCVLMMCV